MKKNSLLIALILICFAIFPVIAVTKIADDPTRIGVGARPLGMGKAYIGMADDISSIYLNPAGLSSLEDWQATSLSASFLNEVNYLTLGVAIPTSRGFFGVGYVGSSLGFSASLTTIEEGRIVTSTETISFGDYDTALLFSYAPPFNGLFGLSMFENLYYGATLKLFSKVLSGTGVTSGVASGYDMDLGLVYRPLRHVSFGLVGQNIIPNSLGGKITWTSGSIESLPSVIKAGLSLKLIGWDGFRKIGSQRLFLNVDADYFPTRSYLPTLMHYGLEWSPLKFIDLRVGIDQDTIGIGSQGIGISSNLTSGIGLIYRGFRFDYAFHRFEATPGVDNHYFSLTYGIYEEKEEDIERIKLELAKREKERLEKERIELAKREKERLERERLAKIQAEQERRERERKGLKKERLERERLALEEKRRLEREKELEALRKGRAEFFAGIGKALGMAGQNVGKALGKTGENVGKGIGATTRGIGGALGQTGQNIGKALGTTGQNIGKALGQTGQNIGKGIGTTGQNIGKALGQTGQNIGKGIGTTGQNIGKALGQTGQNIGKGIGTTGQNIGKALGKTGQNIGKALGTTGQNIGKALGKTGQNIGKGIGTTGQNIGKALSQTGQNIGKVLGQTGKNLGQGIGAAGTGFGNTWQNFGNALTGARKNMGRAIRDMFARRPEVDIERELDRALMGERPEDLVQEAPKNLGETIEFLTKAFRGEITPQVLGKVIPQIATNFLVLVLKIGLFLFVLFVILILFKEWEKRTK